MSTAVWAHELDAFERHLADQRAALDRDEPDRIVAFVPSGDLGTVPPALAARAAALLADAEDLEREIAGALAHIGEDLAVVRKVGAATGRPDGARFIDTKA